MSKRFLVFTFLFVFALFSCGPADAQILSSFFGRSKPAPPPAPPTISALVPEASDIAAAVAAREEMLQSQNAIENQNSVAQVGYNAPAVLQEPVPMPRPVFHNQKIEDERQITIEVRVLTGTTDMFAPAGFTPENGWQFMPKNSCRLNERLEHTEMVGAGCFPEAYWPTLFRFIDKKNFMEFFDHFQNDGRVNILQAPTITLENGTSGTIFDMSETPFVTGYSGDSDSPNIEILKEGTHLTISAKIQDDGSIFLKQCNFQFRKITNKTNSYSLASPSEVGEKWVVQMPQVQTTYINMPITIPQGKSLLVAMLGPFAFEKIESRSFFFGKTTTTLGPQIYALLITPKVIESQPAQGNQLQYKSEDLRQIQDEWEILWLLDQPNSASANRKHGGII